MSQKLFGRVRAKLTYANVVATIALFLALGFGTVYAAGKINGKTIKPNSIPGNRIQNGSLTGSQIDSSTLGTVPKAGRADLAGNANQLGGLDPSDYGAVLSGLITGLTTATNSHFIGAPSGLSSSTLNAPSVEMLSPDHDLTARDLSVQLTTAPGGTAQRKFTLLLNGTASAANPFSCTIQGSATTCNTGSATMTIPASSTFAVAGFTGAAAPAASDALFGLRLTP